MKPYQLLRFQELTFKVVLLFLAPLPPSAPHGFTAVPAQVRRDLIQPRWDQMEEDDGHVCGFRSVRNRELNVFRKISFMTKSEFYG